MSKRKVMAHYKSGLLYLTLLLAGAVLPGGGVQSYHVYSEDWRERECGRVLNRVHHDHLDTDSPPQLTGEWTSYRCEIRSGPEYLLRKYTFSEDTFQVHQYYYQDPDCNQPKYAIVAHGTYKLLKDSWLVPGATESDYLVTKAHVIPYSQDVAEELEGDINKSCKDLGTVKLETLKKQLIISIPPEKSGSAEDKPFAKDIDCSVALNFTLSELQLVRIEIRKHKHSHIRSFHTNNVDNEGAPVVGNSVRKTRELLLGSVHSNRKLRHRHRPSSFQIALRSAQTQGCSVCARISNSNDYYPPELRTHSGTILSLQGDWVSNRCESRHHGMFLTRWLSFLPDGRSWQGRYDFFKDSACSEATFTLTAKGNHVGGEDSPIIPHTKNYSFKVTRLKVTPKNAQVVDHLNHYEGGQCGADKSWEIGIEQDVTFTNGCVTLGIQLPNIEEEILKMEVVHRQLHLLVGSRFTDIGSTRFRDRRPTSFQEPLVKCDRFHRDKHINSIYEGLALPRTARLVSLPLGSSGWRVYPSVGLLVTVLVLLVL